VSTQEVLEGPRQPLNLPSRDSNDCLYDIEEKRKEERSREGLSYGVAGSLSAMLAPERAVRNTHFFELAVFRLGKPSSAVSPRCRA
jgi:hypothetical protein